MVPLHQDIQPVRVARTPRPEVQPPRAATALHSRTIETTRRRTTDWDGERFEADFAESHCYQEPLKLEAGKEGTFLETRYWVEDGKQIRHRLKNDNESGGANSSVWRCGIENEIPNMNTYRVGPPAA